MVFATRFFTLALLILPSFAAAAHLNLTKRAGQPYNGKHMVLLRSGVDPEPLKRRLWATVSETWEHVNGFSGYFGPGDLAYLMRPDSGVETIQKPTTITTAATSYQHPATWGLNVVGLTEYNSKFVDANNTYTYDSNAGSGVVLTSMFLTPVRENSIYTEHHEFGGRVSWGPTFGAGTHGVDINGHGTHVAGIIGSTTFGVAKKANLIAVKTFDDEGAGSDEHIVSGANYVIRNRIVTGQRPSVVIMSGNFPILSFAMDKATELLTKRRVHVVCTTGNYGTDTARLSPANVASVIVVGAVDKNNNKAGFSNYGPGITVFAPGVNIWSTWPYPPYNIVMSGSSMAAAHVAGVVAHDLSRFGLTMTPLTMYHAIMAWSLKDQVIMSDEVRNAGTPNRMAWCGISFGFT